MSRLSQRTSILILLLAVHGCKHYQQQPLDPAAELASLGQRSVRDFDVGHSKPGEGPVVERVSFDPTDGLDESEVIAVALTLNPDLRAKRTETGEAQALLIQAGIWPNPEVGVGWRRGIGGAGHTVDADLLWELLKPWERTARKDIAEARMDEIRAEIAAEEWKLVAETRLQRLNVLSGEQSLALLEQEVSLRERALEIVKRRRDAGDGTELDVSAAALETAEVRRDHRRAETELAAVRRELNRLLGLPPQYDLRLADSGKPLGMTVYDDLPDAELEQRLLAGRFDLRAMESAYGRAEHQLRLAVYRQYPGLKIGPSFGRESEGDNFLGLGVAIEIPFTDRNQGDIAEKESVREKARAAYVGLLHRLKASAYEARARLRRTRLEVEAQEKEVLPLIMQNQELFERAFQARELSILDWVTAQQRTLKARQSYLETLTRYQGSVIELEAATGMPLSSDVEETPKKGD
ncbi:MAG: TolC family protein [Planctomycetota bacterium]